MVEQLDNGNRELSLDEGIDELLTKIRGCTEMAAAEPYLMELGELQTLLATLAFKYRVALTQRQKMLVREYDRFDVAEVRNEAFHAVKEGRFL